MSGPRPRTAAAVWERIERLKDDLGCWPWQGALTADGYGRFWLDGRYQRAHRVVYALAVGPVPEGLDLDHLCRNRACCNPAHLEPVTGAENTRRAACAITHCPAGHEYTTENTAVKRGRRNCRACARAYDRRRGRRRGPHSSASTTETAAARPSY